MTRCARSSAPLASGSRASRISQPTLRAADAVERIGRLAAAGVDRALAVPHQRLRQCAQAAEAAAHAVDQVRRLLGEHQRAGDRAREAQLGGHDIAAAALAMADRDLRSGLPQIELQQLAGAIDRALIGALALIERPDVAQVVIEDRLRPVVAELLDQLADALARDPPVIAQQAMDLVLDRVELRRPPRALIARRALAPQRSAHRVAVMPGA